MLPSSKEPDAMCRHHLKRTRIQAIDADPQTYNMTAIIAASYDLAGDQGSQLIQSSLSMHDAQIVVSQQLVSRADKCLWQVPSLHVAQKQSQQIRQMKEESRRGVKIEWHGSLPLESLPTA